MRVVLGRGNNRRAFELPHGSIVTKAPEKDQQEAKNFLCNLIGIPNEPQPSAA